MLPDNPTAEDVRRELTKLVGSTEALRYLPAAVIEKYKQEYLMVTDTTRAEKLKQLIAAIPSCSAGHKAITALVEEITGTTLAPKCELFGGKKIGIGMVVTRNIRNTTRFVNYLLSSFAPFEVIAINLNTGQRRSAPVRVANVFDLQPEEIARVCNVPLSTIKVLWSVVDRGASVQVGSTPYEQKVPRGC